MIKIDSYKDREEDRTYIKASFDNVALISGLSGDILKQISFVVAQEYVRENYQEIIKHIDQKAIATLSVAEASVKIRETLEKKMPDKVLEIIKKEPLIIQKSIFGTKIIG